MPPPGPIGKRPAAPAVYEGLLFYDAVAALAWAGDLDAAAAILDRAVVRAERGVRVMDVVSARFRRAMVSYLRGSLAAAFDDAQQAVDAAPPGWAVHLPRSGHPRSRPARTGRAFVGGRGPERR